MAPKVIKRPAAASTSVSSGFSKKLTTTPSTKRIATPKTSTTLLRHEASHDSGSTQTNRVHAAELRVRVAESRAKAAECSARSAEARAAEAEEEAERQREVADDWRFQAESAGARLRNAQSDEFALVVKVSEAEQRASRAEGSVTVLQDQALRAVESEQRASAAEVRAARAEGRTEVLCDLHGNLPRMIRAVARTLQNGERGPCVAVADVKQEVGPSPRPGAARKQGALAVEDVGSGIRSRRAGRRAAERVSQFGTRSVSSGQSFDDPMSVLEEMEKRRLLGCRSS